MSRQRKKLFGTESVLPAGYERLEYIYNENLEPYINTDILLVPADVVTLKFMTPGVRGNTSLWGYRWSGSYADEKQLYVSRNGEARVILVGYNGSGDVDPEWRIYEDNIVNEIVFDIPNDRIFLNGSSVLQDYHNYGNCFSNGSSVYPPALFGANFLGRVNWVGSSKLPSPAMRLYEYSVVRGGDYVVNMIPVTSPDGEAGMYDLARNRFFGSDTSDKFLAGPKI